MLTHPLNLKKNCEGVNEKHVDLVLDGSRDSMKQIKAHETSFKQPQNEATLSPKPTLRSKRDRTKVQHMKGKHLQRQSNMVSLGDEASMMVSTFDMP